MIPQDRPHGPSLFVRKRLRFLAAVERLEERSLLSTINVNAATTSATQDGSAANPFKTIQAAIGKSVANDTVLIAAGTYAEALTVNHPLTLSGPNAGIDPNTGVRKAEAVVVPPVNNPVAGRAILVTANNVRIDGLTIDGHNPNLSGGTLLNGISSHAASGVSNVDSTGQVAVISGLTVSNDVIRNFTGFGVIGDINDFSTSTVFVSKGNTISHNLIDNLPVVSPVPGRGVSIEDNFYADVTDNVITRAGTGIQVIFSISPSTAGVPSQISRNVVREYALGIYLWNLDTGTTAYTVADNKVSAEAGATATNVGIDLFRVLDGTGVGLTNNSVTGAGTGIKIDYDTSATPVVVSGGTLSGNGVGVELTNVSPPSRETVHLPVQATLSGVTILNSLSAGVAVTDALSLSAAPVTLNLDALTTVSGGLHGQAISGPYARLVESVKPVVTFTTTPPAQSSSGSAAFGFTASDNLTSPNDLVVNARLDGGVSTSVAGTLNLSGLADGSHTLVVSATDQAGNVGSSTYQWTVTTSGATAPPSGPVLDPASDSGASDGDGVTNVRTPTFLGTALPGSTVTLYAGAIALGTTAATDSGAWAFTVATANALADGVYAVTATASSAGTTSSPSDPLPITIDGTPPSVQTSLSPAPNVAGWYRQAVVASYTATDALGGLDSPATGSFTFTTSGAGQTYTFSVADLAGNVTTATVGPVNIDLTAPIITVLAAPRSLNQTGGLVAVTVTGKISDVYSGITAASFSVTDTLGLLSPGGVIIVRSDGTYSFTVMLDASKRGHKTRSFKISVTAQNAAGLSRTVSTTIPVI